MPCSYEHLWPLILPNVLVFFRIFTLSDHAARKSGTRGEIREDDFSDGITGCLGCLAAQTSGVKNNASALFFTLSGHAARKSGTRGEIREGVFSDGITGCLQPPRGTNIRSEKSCIDKIFHSSFRLKKFRKAAGVCPVLDRKYLVK